MSKAFTGFTALESLVSLAVVALVLSLGTPALQELALNARRSSTLNNFITDVQYARSEAQSRNRPIVLCQSHDGKHCGHSASDYINGWIVFEDHDAVTPIQRETDEDLLRISEPRIDGTVTANRAAFIFRPFPRRSTNGTVLFCDTRGITASRSVTVSYTGRPRIARNTHTRSQAPCS